MFGGLEAKPPIEDNGGGYGGRSSPNEEYVLRLNVLRSNERRSFCCDSFCYDYLSWNPFHRLRAQTHLNCFLKHVLCTRWWRSLLRNAHVSCSSQLRQMRSSYFICAPFSSPRRTVARLYYLYSQFEYIRELPP